MTQNDKEDWPRLNIPLEEAIKLLVEVGQSFVLLEHQGNIRMPGNPRVSVKITPRVSKNNNATEEDCRLILNFDDDIVKQIQETRDEEWFGNIHGTCSGESVSKSVASALYCVKLELEARLLDFQKLLDKVNECVPESSK